MKRKLNNTPRKESILALRKKGKTYNEIQEELGCSKSVISYHCGDGAEKKRVKQSVKKREGVYRKISAFRNRTTRKNEKLRGKVKTFRRSGTHGLVNNIDKNYTYQDVLKKIGETPICYLTGETIDLEKTGTYQLDHIVPTSKGGSNNLDNLAICKKEVNFAKGDLTLNEFYELCEKVIRYKNKIDK